MVEDHKKSESEDESKDWKAIIAFVDWQKQVIEDLIGRVKALEKALMHAQHTNTDDGSRHQNDGGWFD
jgi:hypothetical protein